MAGKPVDAFAILDGTQAAAAYGKGSAAGIERSRGIVANLQRQVNTANDVQVLRTYDLLPEMLVRLSTSAGALRLLNLPSVLSITEDRRNVHWLSSSLPRINQPQVAAMGLIGRGVSVVTLDTGADFTQAAFGGCTQPGQPTATCRVPVAFDAAPDDGAMDDDGHGTNVAAIAAAVAPGANIIPIDVFAGDGTWDHDIMTGVNWVMKHWPTYNIRAVNFSLGSPKTFHTSGCGDAGFWRNPYGVPFAMLRQAGVLPVIAAGNDAAPGGGFRDGISYPACTGGAVVVGATYSKAFGTVSWGTGSDTCTDAAPVGDTITCFSQDAPQLNVVAPGALITAAGSTMGGTSQAAPHVSGAVAVLAGVRPTATAADLESFVTQSSTMIVDPRTGRTHPRLNLLRAVNAAAPVPNDNRDAARELVGWAGQLEQTTWTATKEAGEPAHAGNAGGASVWFRWTASRAGTAYFSTAGSDFDTLLAAYRLNSSGSLVQLAANNDSGGKQTSLVQFSVAMGDTVFVAVDGSRSSSPGSFPESGNLRFAWNLPNDSIAEALPIAPGNTVNGANIGATHDGGEPHHCGDSYATASVWYKWTPAVGATTRIQASGTQALCVSVYSTVGGSSPAPQIDQLTVVASADDLGPYPIDFTFVATPGNTYWIAVDGVSRESHCSPSTGQCLYETPTGVFSLRAETI